MTEQGRNRTCNARTDPHMFTIELHEWPPSVFLSSFSFPYFVLPLSLAFALFQSRFTGAGFCFRSTRCEIESFYQFVSVRSSFAIKCGIGSQHAHEKILNLDVQQNSERVTWQKTQCDWLIIVDGGDNSRPRNLILPPAILSHRSAPSVVVDVSFPVKNLYSCGYFRVSFATVHRRLKTDSKNESALLKTWNLLKLQTKKCRFHSNNPDGVVTRPKVQRDASNQKTILSGFIHDRHFDWLTGA